MKKRMNQVLSVLLALCLIAGLLPAMSITARAGLSDPYLYIGSDTAVSLPPAGQYTWGDNAGGAGTSGGALPSGGYTWHLYNDDGNYILTLNDANISSVSDRGIRTTGMDLEIVLTGDNTVTGGDSVADNDAYSYGVKVEGNLTISGSGTLTVTAGNASANGYNAAYSYGARVEGNLTISGGGTVTAIGGTASCTFLGAGSFGIFANSVTVSGSTLSAASGGATGGLTSESYGIYAYSSVLTVNGGTLTATSGTAATDSQAMSAAPDLTGYASYAATAGSSADGSDAGTYVPASLSTYKYFHITPLYNVWVGDTRVSGDNMANVLGDAGTPTVVYTPAVGTSGSDGYVPQTLTLSGATVNTAYTDGFGHKYGVYTQGNLNLVLADGSTNLIAGPALDISGNCTSYGFHVAGNLTISGAGTLTALAGSVVGENIKSYGISANNLIISSGTVNAFGGAVNATTATAVHSSGIYAIGNITINNGTVTAEGGAASGTVARSYGIFGGTIIINGGTVTAKSASAPTASRALTSYALDLSGYGNASVTASIYSSGSDAGPYVPADIATYKYLLIRPKSATPTAAVTSVAKTAATQASVSFALSNSPPYTDGQDWTVYTSADSSEEAGGVSASNTGNTLTLAHAGDLPVGTYYVSVTEIDKPESDRLALTVTAYIPPSGGGSVPSTPTYEADVKGGDGSTATLPITVDKATGTASIDTGAQKSISGGAVVTIPAVPDAHTYSVGIPVPNLSTVDMQGSLTVETEKGSVTVPSNMLTGVDGTDGSKAQISIGDGDKDGLSEELKVALGNNPLIRLTLSVDGRQTNWSNPTAPVTVSIPYTPTEEELLSPESIVVWYIDGSGNVITIPNGHYHAATGAVIVSLTHFSDYAVAYNKLSFNDVSASAWYNEAVSFIAARGITTGTGGGNFSPEAKLTRGQFIVLMMRAYGIAPDENPADNFSDAGNTWYTGYLAAAKRLGITAGVGGNMYAPDNQITRQEMFTLLYNALKAIGQLPQGDSGKTIPDFTDASQISDWAREAMETFVVTGTVGGSNGKLTPTGTATRAQMAQVLCKLLEK